VHCALQQIRIVNSCERGLSIVHYGECVCCIVHTQPWIVNCVLHREADVVSCENVCSV